MSVFRAWITGAEALRDGVEKHQFRVVVIPNLPKCPVPGTCHTKLTEMTGTGIDVMLVTVAASR